MIKINNTIISNNHPIYFIAEIGINHNADLNNVYKLIKAAKLAGCNAVKFQKETQKNVYQRINGLFKKIHHGERCLI